MRTFSGSEQFEALKKTVVDNYTKLFPVIKSTDPNKPDYSLHLKKIWVDETGLDTNDFPSQKKARLSGNTWGAPVYADIELRDPTGKVADHMSKIRLSTIPKITPRGSYIVGGNEYQVSNQLRKKPGVYVRRRATGDQFKADFSMKDGDLMRNFEVHYDPITAKYKTKIGQSEMPLYTMLHSLGASDDQLRKEWGAEVFAANKVDPSKHVLKLADKFARVSTNNIQTAKEAIQNYANKLQSDPSINEITLGKNHKNLSTAMIIDASKKLKDVYHEKAEPDDPENLLFKEVLSTEDMLHDVLSNQKQQDKLKYALTRQLGRKTKIKDIIDFKKLSSPVETFFTRDNRSGTPEQYNPVHMLSEAHKLTIMGTGGINNPHAITNDIREVHPSHVGFIDPVHTPEGEKVGVTLHLTAGAIKDGRDIRTPAINARTGKMELLTPKQLYSKVVAFPDEAAHNNGKLTFNSPDKVNAQQQGKLRQYKSTEVEYILPSKNALFSHSTNLIPFLHSDQGNRAMMAAKHLGQAIPLVHREAPLVQTDMFGGKTFQEAIGKEFSVVAPVDGKITAIENGYIHIGKTRIPLYHDFPLNQKTYLHHEPNVKVGDVVKKGQLLADSNFTSKGTLALGKNLNVAYLPYPGLTFDDGIVITESAAKKLSAQSITKHTFDVEAGNKESHLNKFIGFYPNSVPKSKHASFDSEGVIKKGTVVNPDDVLIMGLKYELNSPENMTARRINKALMKPWANKAVHYKGEFPGVVSDVIKRADHIDVYVKSVEPAKESDKLSGVHGNKGVITKIIPDHEAPKTADGKIPDVFLNPHGVIGRINLGQIYESAAGKIAEKTGKPYIVKNFSDTKTNQTIANEMKSHGISDMEEMFLPNGKSLGKVHMGKPYILRLASTGKKGFSARTPGAGYDLNLQPTKGGEEGAKALDLMTFYSMLSHGAKKNLIDAHQKSEKNDEYWHAIESGLPLPPPKTTFAFNKFVGMLKGAGINVIDKDSNLYLAPMTDAAVKRISNGAIKEPVFFSAKNMKEKDGGFFDPILTGGKQGNKFTHIELREPLPNPVFEKPIMALTGLDSKSYADIVSGIKSVAVGSKQLTGGAAIQHLLKQIDVTKSITDIGNQLKTTKTVSQVDALNKKLRYLHALKEL
jgi:DNA-directed RNA polymerase subunit beta